MMGIDAFPGRIDKGERASNASFLVVKRLHCLFLHGKCGVHKLGEWWL